MASFETTGVLKVKKSTQQVSEKFSKREFVLTTDYQSQYPQYISMPQTSGGLLVAVDSNHTEAFEAILKTNGFADEHAISFGWLKEKTGETFVQVK